MSHSICRWDAATTTHIPAAARRMKLCARCCQSSRKFSTRAPRRDPARVVPHDGVPSRNQHRESYRGRMIIPVSVKVHGAANVSQHLKVGCSNYSAHTCPSIHTRFPTMEPCAQFSGGSVHNPVLSSSVLASAHDRLKISAVIAPPALVCGSSSGGLAGSSGISRPCAALFPLDPTA